MPKSLAAFIAALLVFCAAQRASAAETDGRSSVEGSVPIMFNANRAFFRSPHWGFGVEAAFAVTARFAVTAHVLMLGNYVSGDGVSFHHYPVLAGARFAFTDRLFGAAEIGENTLAASLFGSGSEPTITLASAVSGGVDLGRVTIRAGVFAPDLIHFQLGGNGFFISTAFKFARF